MKAIYYISVWNSAVSSCFSLFPSSLLQSEANKVWDSGLPFYLACLTKVHEIQGQIKLVGQAIHGLPHGCF